MIARLQFWLQNAHFRRHRGTEGYGDWSRRDICMMTVGNAISDVRYFFSFEWVECSREQRFHLNRLAERLVTNERYADHWWRDPFPYKLLLADHNYQSEEG